MGVGSASESEAQNPSTGRTRRHLGFVGGVSFLLAGSADQMESVIRHAGTWTIDDMMASPWHYLPVEVPAGTAALLVTLSYARDGGAVLDLGCFGPPGFGGWAGGARSSFVVSPLGATPGYLASEVVAGLWQVAIGLYKVPAEGVRYEGTAEAIGGAGWARRGGEGGGGGGGRGWLGGPGAGAVGAAGARGAAGAAGAARGHRAELAGGRPALAHGALRRRPDRAGTRGARGLERAGLRRRHRSQHGQPSSRARFRLGRLRDHAGSRAGGDDLPRSRRGAGRHRVDRLQAVGRLVAGRGRARRRADVDQPPVRGGRQLAAPDGAAPAAARGLALVVARPDLDDAAVMVAGVGSVGDPGRRQRLASAGVGFAAGHADDVGGMRRGLWRFWCA